MPTNRTKRARNRAGALDHWKVDQLMTGKCLIAGVGYAAGISNGCGHWKPEDWERVRKAQQADWATHGADLMAWWRGEHDRYTNQFNSREKYREWGVTHPFAAGAFGGHE
jgi:hypothetical protein